MGLPGPKKGGKKVKFGILNFLLIVIINVTYIWEKSDNLRIVLLLKHLRNRNIKTIQALSAQPPTPSLIRLTPAFVFPFLFDNLLYSFCSGTKHLNGVYQKVMAIIIIDFVIEQI